MERTFFGKNILITGGAGFIASHFVDLAVENKFEKVVVLDKLTYAANLNNISDHIGKKHIHFVKGDIVDRELVSTLLTEHKIDCVAHFAAESHVDNSICGPEVFIQTNIFGTFNLLQCFLECRKTADPEFKNSRFLHVSTDEVFGTLELDSSLKFTQDSPYRPNSPYSASKASSDHLARAWHETYKLPTIITNCSNNYGTRQHLEKFIPTIIKSALLQKPIPIYGNGKNVRDWIHVKDHCAGVMLALTCGTNGSTYCFGGENERSNLELVEAICSVMDEMFPQKAPHNKLINFVKDRAGHDLRYAIDNSSVEKSLSFRLRTNFKSSIIEVVKEVEQRISS